MHHVVLPISSHFDTSKVRRAGLGTSDVDVFWSSEKVVRVFGRKPGDRRSLTCVRLLEPARRLRHHSGIRQAGFFFSGICLHQVPDGLVVRIRGTPRL